LSGGQKTELSFHFPIWLLLGLPLAALLYYWRLPSRLLQGIRIAASVLILVAIAGPAVKLPSRAGTVVVIADRSLSMPPGSEATSAEAIRLVQDAMGAGQQLAVVSFGRVSAIEQSPQAGSFAGFINEVGGDE
jgi:hypothetical protein